jgi:hypothetical protein
MDHHVTARHDEVKDPEEEEAQVDSNNNVDLTKHTNTSSKQTMLEKVEKHKKISIGKDDNNHVVNITHTSDDSDSTSCASETNLLDRLPSHSQKSSRKVEYVNQESIIA